MASLLATPGSPSTQFSKEKKQVSCRSRVLSCCIHRSRTSEIRARNSQIGHNFSLNSLLPSGVAAGVARLYYATPVDPPMVQYIVHSCLDSRYLFPYPCCLWGNCTLRFYFVLVLYLYLFCDIFSPISLYNCIMTIKGILFYSI